MPSISLKAIVLVHWMLFVWTQLAWVGGAYLWCNLTLLAIGIWAIADKQSVDAIFLLLTMQVISCIVDIVCLSLYFSHEGSSATHFSEGMAILNLIIKPFSGILLFQMYRDRGGEYNINFVADGHNTPLLSSSMVASTGQSTPPSYENLAGSDHHPGNSDGSTAFFNPPVVSGANTAPTGGASKA